MIGRARVTRRGAARAVLAVAVAAVAASVVYFGGRALGLGGSLPVAGQADGPVLTIRVSETCETRQARGLYGGIWGHDEDGNWVETGTYGPFYQLGSLNTAELTWSITGGAEPYKISVQGQTLLSGPTGSTLVYCAESLPYDELDFTQSRDDYQSTELDERPVVEPGVMTFKARAEDANGQTATATARTYVVVDCDAYCHYEVLPDGYTYRLFGRLITIPKGLQIYIASYIVNEQECADGAKWCDSYYSLDLTGKGGGHIRLTKSGRFWGYDWNGVYYRPDGTTSPEASQVGGQAAEEHPLADELKQFGRSVGQRPRLSEN